MSRMLDKMCKQLIPLNLYTCLLHSRHNWVAILFAQPDIQSGHNIQYPQHHQK